MKTKLRYLSREIEDSAFSLGEASGLAAAAEMAYNAGVDAFLAGNDAEAFFLRGMGDRLKEEALRRHDICREQYMPGAMRAKQLIFGMDLLREARVRDSVSNHCRRDIHCAGLDNAGVGTTE